MAKLRVGVDVDGILAEFNVHYRELIHELTPIRLPKISSTFPNVWSYERAAGISKEDENKVWEAIKNSRDFWRKLPAYEDAIPFLDFLNWSNADIYFITSRPGFYSKSQTELWLSAYGFEGATVLISSEKGLCAKALNLTHYIDDRNENVADVYINSPKTKTYMLAQPWNQEQFGVPRLESLKDFRKILTEAE